jgi:hypothetical protein
MSRSNIFNLRAHDRVIAGGFVAAKRAVTKDGWLSVTQCSQAFGGCRKWESELLERKYAGKFWSREWELNPRPADFSADIMLLDSRALFLTIPCGFAWYLASFVQKLFRTFRHLESKSES